MAALQQAVPGGQVTTEQANAPASRLDSEMRATQAPFWQT